MTNPADERRDGQNRLDNPEYRDRIGETAYRAWQQAALPEQVRELGTPWSSLPVAFRTPMTEAAATAWQLGENAGYHEALKRTLPSAQLGAAGEIENLRDQIRAKIGPVVYGNRTAVAVLERAISMMTDRVEDLRNSAVQ